MTRTTRGADTAARVLDAALALFAREGFDGFTIHAIVAESGVSLGSVYHHFGSMDGVSAALYARSLGALLDDVGDAVTRARTAKSGIAALVRAYLGFTARRSSAARFIHASAHRAFIPAHAPIIAEIVAPRLDRIFAWVRPFVRDGELVALPEPLFEALVVGPVAEVARRWLGGASGIDLADAERALPPRIWAAVARR